MELHKAKICITCDYLFEGALCPKCGGDTAWQWLNRWLPGMKRPGTTLSFSKRPLALDKAALTRKPWHHNA